MVVTLHTDGFYRRAPCTRTHQSSSLLTRRTLVDSTSPTKSHFGCILPPKFRLVAGNKSLKMAEMCNSESDSENEDHGEVLTGMYTKDIPLDSDGRPIDSRYKLSENQANALRAQAAQPPRPTTQASAAGSPEPTTHSPSKAKLASEAAPKKAAPKAPAPSEHPMKTRSRVGEQESSAKKKRKASRTGGLRPAVGSGSTDTCVPPGHPSQT
jgi:hypothetical protein